MAYLLKVGQMPEVISIPSPEDKNVVLDFLCEQIGAGLLEFVTITMKNGKKFVLICDEMGKMTDKQVNVSATVACSRYLGGDVVVGDCIICDPCEIEDVEEQKPNDKQEDTP